MGIFFETEEKKVGPAKYPMRTLALKLYRQLSLEVLNNPSLQQNLVTLTVFPLGEITFDVAGPHFVIYRPIVTQFLKLLPTTLGHRARKFQPYRILNGELFNFFYLA